MCVSTSTKAILIMAALVFATSASAQPRPGGPRPGPGPAGGQGGMIVEFRAEQIAQLFSEAGFPSKVAEDNQKVHFVLTQFWPDTVSGAQRAYCSQKDPNICHAFKLFALLKDTGVDQTWVNAWNSKYYFVRASLSSDGFLWFDWDVLLRPGVTPEYVKMSATVFKSLVDASSDFKP
jgi:hypothetical protein